MILLINWMTKEPNKDRIFFLTVSIRKALKVNGKRQTRVSKLEKIEIHFTTNDKVALELFDSAYSSTRPCAQKPVKKK